jgi:anthranilate phosphoribosyltransferase
MGDRESPNGAAGWAYELRGAIERISKGEDLGLEGSRSCARKVFELLSKDFAEAPLISLAFFGSLSMKGLSEGELIGIAKAMEETKSVALEFDPSKPVVTAGGTGGDTIPTMNVTTPSVLVAASAGSISLKSGSKSFSSRTGAIDLSIELGINADLSPEDVKRCVDETGTVVWSSDRAYPWMGRIIKLKELEAFPAIVPLMGSLRLAIAAALNPFSLKRQVRGTAVGSTELIATVLKGMGYERALVPMGFGDGGGIVIDEFSNIGKTTVSELRGGSIETYEVTPEEVGIRRGRPEEIASGGSHRENALKALRVLTGKDRGPRRDLISINSAAILYIGGVCGDLRDGVELSEEAMDSGRALGKLRRLVAVSGGDLHRLEALLREV